MAVEKVTLAESAKQRSLRVALDHYVQAGPIVSTKWTLSVIVAVFGAAYLFLVMANSPFGRRQASPGPVAAVHATWDHACTECHRTLHPLRGDSVALLSLGSSSTTHRETVDQACLQCHPGPPHQRNVKPNEISTCATCHRDHRGRDAALTRTSDALCTTCHAQIDSHRNGTIVSPATVNVTAFAPPSAGGNQPHPTFRSLANDPGNIKFNHWLHLQPGVAVSDSKRKLRLNDIDRSLQPQYAPFVNSDGLIKLDCSACHEADRRNSVSSGRYMLPIAYEQHCRGCHPLQVRSETTDGPAVDVPHGLTARRLATVIDGLLNAADRASISTPAPTPDESGTLPLVPGKTLGSNLAQKIGVDLLRRRTKLAQSVRAKCDECHYPATSTTEASTNDIVGVQPANIPPVWLKHARFDHSAHRGVECRVCHAEAYAFERRDQPQGLTHPGEQLPRGYLPARDDDKVMIADIESCTACHAPLRAGKGGARFDCAECHRYHHSDLGSGREASPTSKAQSPKSAHSNPKSQIPNLKSSTLHLVAFQLAPSTPGFPWLGAETCASAGCHGDARPNASPWQNAFLTWLSRDPHAQAYEVLWTFRGREMTRLISKRADGLAQQPLSDNDHFQVLQDRCLGCHATPRANPETVHSDSYTLGVTCESCHGPAGHWIRLHDCQPFDRSVENFIDTKDLSARAAACVQCHVGPSLAAGSPHPVDHDLIAAGHPRLNFDFHSYFESLPPHWNQSQDHQRRASDFHFASWLAGEKGKQVQREQFWEVSKKMNRNGLPDFALLDCGSCHHSIAATNPNRSASGLNGSFPFAISPNPTASSLDTFSSELVFQPRARLAFGRTMLSPPNSANQGPLYDDALRAYLAVRAITADFSPPAQSTATTELSALRAALDDVSQYLASECFAGGAATPTQYDWPTNYQPARFMERTRPLIDALQQLESEQPAVTH